MRWPWVRRSRLAEAEAETRAAVAAVGHARQELREARRELDTRTRQYAELAGAAVDAERALRAGGERR